MIGNKYYKKDGGYEPEIAIWCNNNNATIVDNGDYYEVVKIEISIDNLKSSKKQEINQAREQARLDEGAEYDNDLFDIDEKSQANITAIVSMLMANNVPEQFVSIYRSKTNKDHSFNKAQMVELGTVIGAKVTGIYKKSWDLKEQIDKANTVEEVESIKWNM